MARGPMRHAASGAAWRAVQCGMTPRALSSACAAYGTAMTPGALPGGRVVRSVAAEGGPRHRAFSAETDGVGECGSSGSGGASPVGPADGSHAGPSRAASSTCGPFAAVRSVVTTMPRWTRRPHSGGSAACDTSTVYTDLPRSVRVSVSRVRAGPSPSRRV